MKAIVGVMMAVALIAQGVLCGGVSAQDATSLIAQLTQAVDSNEKLSANGKQIVKDILLKECTNATFVQEVKAQNAKAVALDAIKAIDTEWQGKGGDVPLQEELLNNTTANAIMAINSNGAIIECFVMDNQGAIVGANNNTSDYWQGDEPKFINAYNGGKGGIDVGDKEVDASTGVGEQKVSLPIIAEDGSIVGAVCYGLDAAKMN